MSKYIYCLLLFCVSCAEFSVTGDPIENSDRIAMLFTRQMAELYPELGSSVGLTEYDSRGTVITDDLDEREQKFFVAFKQKIDSALERVSDPQLKIDLLLLRDRIQEGITLHQLEEQHKVLPFAEVSKTLFNNLFPLLRPDSTPEQKKAGLARFKAYADPVGGEAYPLAYIRYFNSKVNKYSGAHFYPYKQELEQYLKESPLYTEGIGKMLAMQHGDQEWQEVYQKYLVAIQTYDNFVQQRILPYARKTPQLPAPIYQTLLKGQGIPLGPKQLIKLGKREFESTWQYFEELGKKLAAKHKLKSSDPADVIRYFKREKFESGLQALTLYQEALQQLEKIVAEKKLMKLPEDPLRARLATVSEAKANPVPHLDIPLLRGGPVGERPELILPVLPQDQLPFDDFAYKNAVMTIAAHEGRPGHELQFSSIIGKPISILRARYAQSATNVEGWALYAEDLVLPFMPDEQRFVALQGRLWRQARYFLDPQVQTQGLSQEQVKKVLGAVGVSEAMAGYEYQRYAFQGPGQAAGYYHGLLEIKEFKAKLKREGRLNQRCFNDTLVSLGLVPFKYIDLLKDEFKPCLLR